MSYYPGQQGYGAQGHGGYGGPPQSYSPQPQQYNQYNQGGYPPQPGYGGGYPQQQQYGGGPQGYGTPPPQVAPYGYSNPPPQSQGGYGYGAPPPQPNGYPGPRPGMPNAYQHQGRPPPPPAAAQQFGHGAPSQYQFQYSQCTGKRKALLIGINYFGQRGELRGCINDVKNMSTYLNQNFGYAREDMVILTDDQQNEMSQPKKRNILRAMHWLVKDARPNDSLFFHYSGHGGQTPDLDGDEEDGYDEVIYPVDFRTEGHIVDDEMHRIMVNPLQPGVRLTAIFDSCHSGSALDLPYLYSTSGVLKEPNLAKEAGQGLLSIVSSYARGDLGGMASTAMGLFKKAATGNSKYERTKQTKTSPADVIMWSGSKDEQTSQDAVISGEATGAMSWAFVTALKKNPHQSYVQLLNSIRDELSTKYSQKPQLSCSHPLNTDILYVM
ncbi:Ca(2+)-dependent cysteine protease [Knufia obscura]|uniref:Ca(2+)-dependent cysteine protease n=2 Tax=Knufia TaxID=430999 RepID=A0AAN8ED72_9EURO|nr:Ca(2+)-dependent cysteine protease [Knufia obscura]KAK5952859.1 Ca(2+)-dependent cysteine protease [Knufia fluminis]